MRLHRLLPNRDSHRPWLALLEAALVLLLAIQAARLLWVLLAPVATPLPPALEDHLSTGLAPLAGQDPFFGGTAAAATPAASALDSWRLAGLRTGADGGSAILAREREPQRAYRPGDELAPGLVLAGVAADHVLVRHGGATRRLDLPQPASGSTTAQATAAGTSPVVATPAAAGIDAAAVDPGQLLARSGLKAHSEGGQVVGYTVMPQGNGALLRLAGLRPGDVLLRVNQQPLAPGTFAEVAGELEQNRRATIEFRRDGQVQSVTLGSGTP